MINKKNILELLLEQLGVKFTKNQTKKFYEDHLYKKSLFGMSQMLSDYNIENTTIKIKNKSELSSLEPPFVTNVSDNIILVQRITEEKVQCAWNEEMKEIPIEYFKTMWNGVALIPEKKKDSVEPNYTENLKKQIFQVARKSLLIVCTILLFFIGFFTNSLYSNIGLSLLSIVNLVGVYIGYLLLQKQLYIRNDQADKICSLFKKGGCNNVLNSSASKFMGLIGWSEIGFSYFISNVFISVLFPQLVSYLALINICALPYSFWSVWYQRFRVKQWCPLCLIVQILFWIIFIINFVLGFIIIPQFIITEILLIGIIYALPFLAINILSPSLPIKKQLNEISKEMNKLRMKPEIFKTLLKQQPHYDVDLSTSQIIWGNRNAKTLITIVTNPHCEPCAEMHQHINKLLKKAGSMLCIQYILSSFNGNLESSNEFLTAAYLSDIDLDQKKNIYNEWFEKGKFRKEDFFKKYKFETYNQSIVDEVNRHKEWKSQNNIKGTPTILINGYELPYYYRIEDIIYLVDFE